MPETNTLTITEVHITLIKPDRGLIAMAKVILSNALVLDSIGIHTKLQGGYRLTYPMKNGRYLYHPVSREHQRIDGVRCHRIRRCRSAAVQ